VIDLVNSVKFGTEPASVRMAKSIANSMVAGDD
jgi:hypothetical protein